MVPFMGFPFFDDNDDYQVWKAVGRLNQEWEGSKISSTRGARFESILEELVRTAGWPRQGKRLASHLVHCMTRGSIHRIEKSRKNVRYEQTIIRVLPLFFGLYRPRRGRPRRPRVPDIRSDVGIAPDSELAKWVEAQWVKVGEGAG